MTQDKQAEVEFFDNLAENFNANMNAQEQYGILDALGILDNCGEGNILEVGCGTGEFGRMVASCGARVIGIDISPGMIEENRRRSRVYSWYFSFVHDVENTTTILEDFGPFDSILCINFLHHFRDRSKVLNNFHCWLKSNGYIYIYEPNGANPAHKFFTFCRDVLKYTAPFILKRLSSSNDIKFVEPTALMRESRESEFVVDTFKTYDQHSKPDTILSYIRYFITGIINLFTHKSTSHFILIERKGEN